MKTAFAQNEGKEWQEVIAAEMSNVVRLTLRIDGVVEYHCHGGQQEIQFLEWQLGFLKFRKQHGNAIQGLRRWCF